MSDENLSKEMSDENLSMEELYNQSIKVIKEYQIIKGKIIAISSKEVVVDVGFKSEGVVPSLEFPPEDLQVGSELDFFVESIEDDAGMIRLSREKALRISGWDTVVKQSEEGTLVNGRPVKKVKGGFLVDVMGIEGFLPASLSAFKGVSEKEIINKTFKFKIVKMNNLRRSLIVSRKEAIQKEREEIKEKVWENLAVGQVVAGTVKAITDFGAFIDLGGVDGLLHITDMSWSKVSHPSEVVAVGDKIEVAILNLDREAAKVSLGLKQRTADPWSDINTKYNVGTKVKGKIVNILPYGVFIELEKGIEGLIHVSEISWTRRINNPQEIFAIGDMVEAQILSIEKESRRISLSLKQLEQNPWLDAENKYSAGSKINGKIRGFTDYGVFVELDGSLEGMVHISDLSWTKRINHPQDVLKKGQKVEVVVLSVDAANRRINLGLKQLQPNPWPQIAEKYPLETVIEAEVVNITDFGVFVKIEDDLEALIYSSEIDKEQIQKLKPQDKVKAKIIKVDVEQGKIGLSGKL